MRRTVKWLAALAAILVVAFLLLRTPDTDPAAMRAKYGGPPSQFVALGNGLTVHVRDEGPRNAPAIVLLHGSNADLHTWEPWAKDLSRDYRVVRFDQIGHGLTGANPSGDYSPAAYVDGVRRVADRLGLERFVLAGNSMGGAIAVRFALNHPERLDGLVLIDAGGAPRSGKARGNTGFNLAATPGVSWLLRRITPRSLVERSLRQSVSNQAIVTDAAVDRYWELLRYPGNRDATVTRFSSPRTTFDPAILGRIRIPTLILWGERDALISVDGANWFARAIPGSQLITYPGIGHLPMEEAPAKSVADLREWLVARCAMGGCGAPAPPGPTQQVDAPPSLP